MAADTVHNTTGSVQAGSVAVLIAAYQAAETIGRAIESALNQTKAPIQIVVVDDGSTDATGAVAESFRTRGVTIIQQQNSGVSAARNRGLREVTAEFVAFLDADDWWAPEKLAVQVEMLTARPDKIATYTGVITVDTRHGAETRQPPTDEGTLWPQLRWTNPFIPPSSVMMRSAALRAMGGFREDLAGGEDWAVWLQVKRREGFVTTPDSLTYYSLSSGGLSGDAEKMFESFLLLLDGALLEGLTGWQRVWWRRRLVGFQAYKAALTARARGERWKERRYMQQSFQAWPSPFWPAHRTKSALVTFLRRN